MTTDQAVAQDVAARFFKPEPAPSALAGLLHQEQFGDEVRSDRDLIVLAWRGPRGLIIGRQDNRLPNVPAAEERLAAEGWPVLIRRSGGTACPVSPGTLQIALARPAHARTTIDGAFGELAELITVLLAEYGIEAKTGEIPEAFCPGRYDMAIEGRKIAGLSQHWRPRGGRMVVTTAATLLVDEDHDELSRIVDLFYETAGGEKRCLPEVVGSVRHALPPDGLGGAALTDDLCARLARLTTQLSA
ncbi:hypothetical protein OSH11_14265 [Kaistia dalseonensis]|uniref:Lipoate-protein ligase A n=1 Tax=Kaistia dalseonensis TaxID=410840 RepID=A0ABU0H9N5_9HYPH|nr:hypothetical protein [Kaistia dalseonensis]MCX5495874.1 hypothetical protein [Kaistia dalseonensis]MDQ0438475.1 lipoate-protein ligase A [Kaistia dalseonensis]